MVYEIDSGKKIKRYRYHKYSCNIHEGKPIGDVRCGVFDSARIEKAEARARTSADELGIDFSKEKDLEEVLCHIRGTALL